MRAVSYATALLICLLLPAATVSAENAIVTENERPGAPASQWDVDGAGDPAIQGFATDISVDQGETVRFKILTPSSNYRIDVYRLGWYDGLGARQVASIEPSATLPQSQPECLEDPGTGLIDCGNWGVSAVWTVPSTATSGIYIARLVREDVPGASHIPFVVRDDDGGSKVLFQTSDTTWQAYNTWGGNSLYTGSPAGRAYKVSYNRPFTTRCCSYPDGETQSFLFSAEYPMLRWLERNGYDVSYSTGVDTDRRGAELLEHDLFLSVGHDEYWSATQRASVEAARGAGVHLGFFSGNEIFWKTRWEASIDGSGTSHRTLVTYKETHANGKIDPNPAWTGTWRDPRFSPPADGGRPENALAGTIFTVNGPRSDALEVPAADGKMRFWRNTSVAALAPGAVALLPEGTLGYEWDEDLDNGSRPPGVVRLSTATVDGVPLLQDFGSNYASGTATHHLLLYRHQSGALVFGAGTVQWSWGLDAQHDLAGTPVDARMQQATVNLFADMGVQPETLQGDLVSAAISVDGTPPTSIITSPANGATVSGTIAVVGSASDVGGQVGGVEVSVDGGATWHPANGRGSWAYSFTPAALGPISIRTRAVDDSGNLETAGPGINVTAVAQACPCTLWDNLAAPATPNENDPSPVELGVRFRASSDGYVTGLRFYKGPLNTGTHVGHLWSSNGTLLGQATFSAETASGWQEVALSPPVAVSANTTYVASYHTTVGYYAVDSLYFATAHVRPPLTALADGDGGGNGVYRYGGPGFPNQTFASTNYWVDVVFDAVPGEDVTPPTVVGVAPLAGSNNVGVTATVLATFSEGIDPASLTNATFQLRDAANALVPTLLDYDPITHTAMLDASAALAFSSTYTARVVGGAAGVRDLAGFPLAQTYVWSFTTEGPPPPGPEVAPGGPILVVASAANPFGRYYAEILRTEGLNAFDLIDVAALNAAALASHELVVLGDVPLTPARVALLESWVADGGKLLAMRPDKKLAPLLGLIDENQTLSQSYLAIDGSSAPGAGLVSDTIQFHGTADLYTLGSATAVASLYATAAIPTVFPAVTRRSVGTHGGQAAAWSFDLARSVVLTRQGNPAWAGTERDDIPPVRSNDQFFGPASGDPQPDWIDLDKVAIPQADEQQRLFAKLIRELLGHPFPSFWYFPSFRKAVVLMTGDEHGCCDGTRQRWDAFLASDPPQCSVEDWQCVRGTSYVYPGSGMSDPEASSFAAQGFELATHVTTGCSDWTLAGLEDSFASQLAEFSGLFPSVPAPHTNRTHCIVWSDWASHPVVERANLIRLDTNYYYYPQSWIANRPGFFTGSGMPMRFTQTDGTFIDAYQAVTQMTDESGQSYPFTIDTLLDRALGPEGYYGAFTANMHTDFGNGNAASWAAAIVASAQARGVAVVSARQMLEWIDGRNASSFDALSWDGEELEFDVDQAPGARNLRALLPMVAGARMLASLTRGGQPVTFVSETIKGAAYAVFAAETGSYLAVYLQDVTAPLLTNPAVQFESDDLARISWSSNEPASSTVVYGTDPGSLTQSVTSATLVTGHLLTLSGIAPATTYYYRVSSVDGAGNGATAPPLQNPPASFTTPCFADSSASDFAAGTNQATVTASGVSLAPALDESFAGPGLPPGWSATQWTGGNAVPIAGALFADGARAGSGALFASGSTLEFSATFSGEAFQHVGFGVDYNVPPWATFSTGGGGTIKARTHDGSAEIITDLGIAAGAPHVFRVVWSPTQVQYYVEGSLVATHPSAVATPMRPLASDYNLSGSGVAVDWLRLAPPFAPVGTFTSRVADTGHASVWGATQVGAATPPGTNLSVQFRTGSTPVPDGSWTAFAASAGQVGRYAQYRAEFATSNPSQTPLMTSVSIACGGTPVCGDGVREGAEECDDANILPGDGCSATCLYESADADGDGLPNSVETGTGIYVSPTNTGTNPLDPDSDDDGASDGVEVAAGGNPLDADSDDDGFCDGPSAPPGPPVCSAGDNCPLVANAGQADADGDLVGDVCDNCIYAVNVNQADTGGVFASSADGIGNACQCGDVSDAVHAGPDFGVNQFDGEEIRLYLAGISTLPPGEIVERCSVDGVTGACTVADWAVLARADALVDPSVLAQMCRPAVCLVDPSDLDGDCLIGALDLCKGWPNSSEEQTIDTNSDTVPDTCQCGDLDRDGDVDSADEQLLGSCILGLGSCDPSLADLNRDGIVDLLDGGIYGNARDDGLLSTLGCTRRLGPGGP